jgi:hypothetical protein
MAEDIAISGAVKEVKFSNNLLCDLHIKVNLPIQVYLRKKLSGVI